MEPQAQAPGTGPTAGERLDSTVRRQRQRFLQQLALGVLAGVFAGGLLLLMQAGPGNGTAAEEGVKHTPPPRLFRNWNKPDLALVVSGQMNGYHQPCGCSHPQYGGLPRRYNFIQSLRKKGWTVAAIDLGDLAQKSGPQLLLKYEYAMKGLKVLDYSAIGVGKNEMNVPLWQALSTYSINKEGKQPRVLAANLLNRDKGAIFHDTVHDWEIIDKPGAPTVGVLGLIGPSLSSKTNDPDLQFDKDNAGVVTRALSQLKANKVQLVAILYQGSLKEAQACARFCDKLQRDNPGLPPVQLVLCLSEQEEPPATPSYHSPMSKTMVITVGHKGRYVGVVGVFRDPGQKGHRLEYQLVSIGEDLQTPDRDAKNNPIMELLEEYAQKVKDGDYLSQYRETPHPVQVAVEGAKYVGSERCLGCHDHAAQIWLHTAHSKAYDTLVDVKHPSLRQFDGECVACHVTGFGHDTGFVSAWKAQDKRMIERLKHVGCESCHGPGSEHIKNTRNPVIHRAMNPWKATADELNPATDAKQRERLKHARLLNIDIFCQKCHDTDNDVHWNFAKNWPKIAHPTPPEERKKLAAQAPVPAETPAAIPVPPEEPAGQPQFQPQPQPQPKGSIFNPLNLFKKTRRSGENP